METSFEKASLLLAEAFLLGSIEDEATLIDHASSTFLNGQQPEWLKAVASSIAFQFTHTRNETLVTDIAKEIKSCEEFQQALREQNVALIRPENWEYQMRPKQGRPENWQIPTVVSTEQLADLLNLQLVDLTWLVTKYQRPKNYHYTWHRKRNNSRGRLIESPKPLLKNCQKLILSEVLSTIEPHPAACGFRVGKSIIDYVSPHCGRKLVLKMDLQNFFTSIRAARVNHFFMAAGYPKFVAEIFAKLCTNKVHINVLSDARLDSVAKRAYCQPHLPQGAPTSPALANLIAYRLDCRLAGLAKSAGVTYTRYADDLLFSGDQHFINSAESFLQKVTSITIDEGFLVNSDKTRLMKAGQRQMAAGLLLNEKPNLNRAEYDRLKAILTNCRNQGAETQNHNNHPDFRSHLEGRINWVNQSNPKRASKLRAIFDAIHWPSDV